MVIAKPVTETTYKFKYIVYFEDMKLSKVPDTDSNFYGT